MSAPGEVVLGDGNIEINAGRDRITLHVKNAGDRPAQVGSHYHFFEANRALEFDRAAAFGYRLDIPAGTAVRFEPGMEAEVQLVAFKGTRRVFGFSGVTSGSLDSSIIRNRSLQQAADEGFGGAAQH